MSRIRIVLSVALVGLLLSVSSAAAPNISPFDEGGTTESNPHAKPANAADKPSAKEADKSESDGGVKSHLDCLCAAEGERAAIDRIERALQGPLSAKGLDFVETPLRAGPARTLGCPGKMGGVALWGFE